MGLLENYLYYILVAFPSGYMLFKLLNKGRNSNPNRLPLPPGPKGYPLIGNVFDMPGDQPWLVYDKWYRTYGDMVYYNIFGQHFLVLNSVRRTTDLFEKKSSNYSDRTRLPMVIELMGWDINLGFLPYGPWWRKHRRSFHEYFHPNASAKYQPIQKREVQAFLHRLLHPSDNLCQQIQHAFAAIIIKVSYGIDVEESDDPYISVAEEALSGLAEAGLMGSFWVDFFPVLKYVPSWVPGAGFQKKAAYWREVNATAFQKPFNYVKEQLKDGKTVPSVAASLIERLPEENDPKRPMEERLAQDVAFVAYAAGTHTTSSSVQALFLALAIYPEVQKKAQAEIDAVVGPNRLPGFEDRSSLPYINALVKETMRWHSVLPLGVAHMATNDDEYNGYYIPKGTVVIGNIWSIMHDPKAFNNPMEFQPERYLKDGRLNPDVRDPNAAAFGFGRRICPGRHLNDNSLYSISSSLLAVYDIKPPVDDQGNSIKLEPEFTSGLMSHPFPFQCIIKPRTPAAKVLIRDLVKEDN